MEETTRLTIREAETSDVSAIHEIFVRSIQAIGSEYYSAEQKRAWQDATALESWTTRLLELTFYVVQLDEDVVGFVSWYGQEIVHVYVLDTVKDQGVGTGLMDFALATMTVTDIGLTASLNAEGFYKKFGFQSEETLIKERDGVSIPCIRMRRISV